MAWVWLRQTLRACTLEPGGAGMIGLTGFTDHPAGPAVATIGMGAGCGSWQEQPAAAGRAAAWGHEVWFRQSRIAGTTKLKSYPKPRQAATRPRSYSLRTASAPPDGGGTAVTASELMFVARLVF
ncbi:hypothetical protein ARTHRO9AX_10216 [Arthrobacter sp. 9AX]|nr:hypothetical protein ARTHRO9AX_10216 [Arthrobacter sp. 9AX]